MSCKRIHSGNTGYLKQFDKRRAWLLIMGTKVTSFVCKPLHI